jgi:putative FmdB family regulatory protein
MPIYEYQCPDCSGEFELMQKVGAEAPPCPKCGGTKTARMLSRTSFVLKGGGWYKDGYSGTSNQKGGSSAAPAAPPPSTTSGD